MTTFRERAALPPQIEVHEAFEEVRYVLPPRPLGKARLIGLVPLAVGLVLCALDVFFVLQMLGGMGANSPGEVVLFALAVAVPGLAAIAIGYYLLAGTSEVAIARGELRSMERAGLFRWTRRRRLDAVRQVAVVTLPVKVNNRPVSSGPLAELAALRADCEGAKPFWFALAYPASWLSPLAHDMARRFEQLRPDPLVGPSKPNIEIVEETLGELETQDVLEQPADSKVVVERHASGVTLTVPAAGVWRGAKGLAVFAVLWLVITGSIAVAFNLQGGQFPWWARLMACAFPLVGIGVLARAVNMGRRRAVLAVVGDSLMVLQSSPFRTKRGEWRREQLAAIRVGPSGMKVNDRPVLQLQVQPKEGRKTGLLTGRDETELRWIATELRRALELPRVG